MSLNGFSSLGANLGKVQGDIRPKDIRDIYFTRGFKPTRAQLANSATLLAALRDAAMERKESPTKVFAIGGFHNVEDGTGEPESVTSGSLTEIMSDPLPRYTFSHSMGAGQAAALRKFNGWSDDILVTDSNGQFFYVNAGNRDGSGLAFDIQNLYVPPVRFTGRNAIFETKPVLTFANPNQFVDGNLSNLAVDFTADQLANIVDVELSEDGAATGYAFNIVVRTKFNTTNIFEGYKDLLNQSAAWEFLLPDGSIVAASTVAKNQSLDQGLGGWVVTATSSPTIASGVKMKARLKSPKQLNTLTTPIGLFDLIESNILVVTKP